MQYNSRGGKKSHKVYINLYDLTPANGCLRKLGLAVYHSGVEVADTYEYWFGSHHKNTSGVVCSTPKKQTHGPFYKSVYIGTTNFTFLEIEEIVSELRIEYLGSTYDIFKKNCHNFSAELIKIITNKDIPTDINRIAQVGNSFRCCFPYKFVQGPRDSYENQLNDSVLQMKKKNKKNKKKSKKNIQQLALLSNPDGICNEDIKNDDNLVDLQNNKYIIKENTEDYNNNIDDDTINSVQNEQKKKETQANKPEKNIQIQNQIIQDQDDNNNNNNNKMNNKTGSDKKVSQQIYFKKKEENRQDNSSSNNGNYDSIIKDSSFQDQEIGTEGNTNPQRKNTQEEEQQNCEDNYSIKREQFLSKLASKELNSENCSMAQMLSKKQSKDETHMQKEQENNQNQKIEDQIDTNNSFEVDSNNNIEITEQNKQQQQGQEEDQQQDTNQPINNGLIHFSTQITDQTHKKPQQRQSDYKKLEQEPDQDNIEIPQFDLNVKNDISQISNNEQQNNNDDNSPLDENQIDIELDLNEQEEQQDKPVQQDQDEIETKNNSNNFQ